MVRVSKIFFVVAALSAATTFYSCKKENSDIAATKGNIQGKWKHEYNIEPDLTMPPEFELIKFINDSFYLKYNWSSEFLTPKCPEGKGTNYVKGRFEMKEGKLYFDGVFTTEDYIVNIDSSGCLPVGNWADSFKISLPSNNVISLYWLIPIKSLPESHRIIKLNRIN